MRVLTLSAVLACLTAALLSSTAVAEGKLATLYAPRPPEGSAFVRFANPTSVTQAAKIGGAEVQTVGGDQNVATRYAIVSGDTPFDIELDGASVGTLSVKPGSSTTVVLRPSDNGQSVLFGIDDTLAAQDAMKVVLRFYNFGNDCPSARLSVYQGKAVIFNQLAPQQLAVRAINPVKATLAADCGGQNSQPYALPALNAGDHFSLFLSDDAPVSILKGQLSETDSIGR